MTEIYRTDNFIENARAYSKADVEATYNIFMYFWYQELRQLFQPTED